MSSLGLQERKLGLWIDTEDGQVTGEPVVNPSVLLQRQLSTTPGSPIPFTPYACYVLSLFLQLFSSHLIPTGHSARF